MGSKERVSHTLHFRLPHLSSPFIPLFIQNIKYHCVIPPISPNKTSMLLLFPLPPPVPFCTLFFRATTPFPPPQCQVLKKLK